METGEKLVIKYLPLLIILAAVGLRILPHPANFAPIGAMALFGGTYLPKKYALAIPILAMLVSDFFLGFHSTLPWVYASFILIALMGMAIRKKVSFTNIALTSLTGSVLFFLITNLGVFVSTNLYPRTWLGLIDCFVMAIPFFRNTLISDVIYNSLFFGSFSLLQRFILSRISTNHANH